MMNDLAKPIITTLEPMFAKAPPLPANGKELIVKFTPIIALIFGVLGVVGVLGALGLLTVFLPFGVLSDASGYGIGYIAALISLASSVLLLMAYPGTKARTMQGWNMLFWSELLSIAGSVVAGQIVSALLSALIGFYILFQIKSYYK